MIILCTPICKYTIFCGLRNDFLILRILHITICYLPYREKNIAIHWYKTVLYQVLLACLNESFAYIQEATSIIPGHKKLHRPG